MSYRDCRNFTEMLRSLNYPRLVSIENFKRPNFELVADILYWLAHRYDPQTEISDNIDEERDRIEFIKAIVTLFSTKARIKLNAKKLYQADSNAVQEMLKVTTVLYKAYNSSAIQQEEAGTFALPTKISNLKLHKILANQINELGAKLYDSLAKETQLKKSRQQALNFIEGMGRSDSDDQTFIEKSVKGIIKQQEESMSELSKYVVNMEKEQKNLEEKIKKKTADFQRAQKRYKTMMNVKPAFMQEYQRLEIELERLYQVYVEKYRNLDYLENQLDQFNKIDQQKFQNSQKALKKMQAKIREDEMRQIRGEQEIDEAMLAAQLEKEQIRGVSRGNSRSNQNRIAEQKPNQPGQQQQQRQPSNQQSRKGENQRNMQKAQQLSQQDEQEQQSGEQLEDDEEEDAESDDNF